MKLRHLAWALVLALPACCGAATQLGPLKPGYTVVDLPEGNYNVTVTLGGAQAASTTIKAELRRLMLENVATRAGETVQRSFTVNVRTPAIAGGGQVALKAPRETVEEAWAWDPRLTLEVAGENPAVQSVRIVRADTPTLFLLGDSTVCDQPGEPYSSWGQMLPRFFKTGLAVANHAESGETLRDSLARRRLDKIISVMQPGDTVLFQFGHNDQKQIKAGQGSLVTYQDELRTHVKRVLAAGGIPVVVSSMERRAFDPQGKVIPSLIDYADAARQVANEWKVRFIDLNADSKVLYQALGQEGSRAAFAEPSPGKIDNTHHNSYGGYALAKIVVTALRKARLPVAAFIADDFHDFDPAHPDPVGAFKVPASAARSTERPAGDEDTAYLFTYFTKNGEDGLHLAISRDGYAWEKLGGGRSYLTPTVGASKLMRDPCIVRGPDGRYHMVWTSGWNENTIGYAHSSDLLHWSGQKAIPVMAHEAGVLNAWAPEIVYDDARTEFLIFWSSTVPGRFPQTAGGSEEKYNHRVYATTTRDFATFTPSRLFYDPGFSVIDATFIQAGGRRYWMVKDETRYPPKKHLRLAGAPDLQGPFGALSAPVSPPGLWVEGPTSIQVGADTIVYYDAYTARHYGAMRSRDGVHWDDVTARMHFPDEGTPQRMRHGTAIAIPGALANSLRQSEGATP